MQFFNYEHKKLYYKKYANLSDFGYGKYFGYSSVSTLISKLIDVSCKNHTNWDSVVDSQYAVTILKIIEEEDIVKLRQLLKHGNFFESYFNRYLTKKYQTKLLSNHELYEDIVNCSGKDSKNEKYIYQRIFSDLVGVISLKYLDTNDISNLKKSVHHFIDRNKECLICGKKFSPIFYPEWLYFRMNGNINICYECPSYMYNKNTVAENIRELVTCIGFIPNTSFQLFPDNNFTLRVERENWVKAFQLILNMGGNLFYMDHIKELFGSWFKALVFSEVLTDNQIVTKRGVRCLSDSGNECNSLDERYIDNYFFKRNFKMVKEPKYPAHPIYNPKGLSRADWLINGVYVEYFGLKGDEAYDLKTQRKVLLCIDLNIKLVSIFPEDLSNLDNLVYLLNENF